MTTDTFTFEMLNRFRPLVLAKLEELNKRAAKLKLEPVTVEFEVFKKGRTEYAKCRVKGVRLQIPGYTFVATVEHEKAGNILYTVPGQSVPDQYRSTDGYCDHCQTKRYRKQVYVFRKEDGSHIQVGSNCLRDFMGDDPGALLLANSYARELQELSDEENLSGWAHKATPSLREVIAYTIGVIRVDGGYISKAVAMAHDDMPSTRFHVYEAMYPSKATREYAAKVEAALTEEDEKVIDETIEFAKGWANSSNEYEYNLSVIARGETVKEKQMGLAVSLYPTVNRIQTLRKVKAEQNAVKAATSEYIGKVGERVRDIEAACVEARFISQTQFGDRYLYKFQSDNVTMIWFTEGRNIEVGNKYVVTGTVKEHTVYNGVKQTSLTNCKIKEL